MSGHTSSCSDPSLGSIAQVGPHPADTTQCCGVALKQRVLSTCVRAELGREARTTDNRSVEQLQDRERYLEARIEVFQARIRTLQSVVDDSRRLTARQEKFLRLITTLPIPSMARAARQAGYSESVARKPKIICESPSVLEAWNRWWNTTFNAVY